MKRSIALSSSLLAALAAFTAPTAAQDRTRPETHGSSTTMRQTIRASASHDDWERGRLISDIDYLGRSARAYDVSINGVKSFFSYARYQVSTGAQIAVQGIVFNTERRIVPPTSGNLFASDVSKNYWLTTGSFTVAGNVTSTASMDITFDRSAPARWGMRGNLRATAQGSMRLVGSWLTGMLRYDATFGGQEFAGDFSAVYVRRPTNPGVIYKRSDISLELSLAAPALFGTSKYTTLLSTSSPSVWISRFLLIL